MKETTSLNWVAFLFKQFSGKALSTTHTLSSLSSSSGKHSTNVTLHCQYLGGLTFWGLSEHLTCHFSGYAHTVLLTQLIPACKNIMGPSKLQQLWWLKSVSLQPYFMYTYLGILLSVFNQCNQLESLMFATYPASLYSHNSCPYLLFIRGNSHQLSWDYCIMGFLNSFLPGASELAAHLKCISITDALTTSTRSSSFLMYLECIWTWCKRCKEVKKESLCHTHYFTEPSGCLIMAVLNKCQ